MPGSDGIARQRAARLANGAIDSNAGMLNPTAWISGTTQGVAMRWQQLTRAKEHERLMREYATMPFETLMATLERQFSVLHNRSQILLTLCGIIITTTGFSGRFIAATGLLAQISVVLSIVFVLLAAGVVVWRVLHLHWLTGQLGDDRSAWLMRSLEYRDYKTMGYRIGITLLMAGLCFYVVAIAIMLFHPASAIAVK
jgi:hypothetical protein